MTKRLKRLNNFSWQKNDFLRFWYEENLRWFVVFSVFAAVRRELHCQFPSELFLFWKFLTFVVLRVFWFLHFFGDFMLGHRLSAATSCPRASDIPCGTPGANLPFFNKNQMLIRDSKNRRCLTFVFQTQLMGNAFGQIFWFPKSCEKSPSQNPPIKRFTAKSKKSLQNLIHLHPPN